MINFFEDVLKYLAILFSTLYSYKKLTGERFKIIDLIYIPLLLGFAVGLHYIDLYVKIIAPMCMLFFFTVVFKIRYRTPWGETINMATISLGIAVFLTLISFVLSLPVLLPMYGFDNEELRNLFAQIAETVFIIIFTFVLFKIKRFKSAIVPLKNDGTYDALTFAGIISIFAMTLFYISSNMKIGIMELSFLFLAFSTLTLIIGWRRVITRRYRQQIMHRNIEHLEKALASSQQEQRNVIEKNEELAKIIHRDNKLIPSMMIAVENCIKGGSAADAQGVLDELKKLYEERTDAVLSIVESATPLKKTGDFTIDSIMEFLRSIGTKHKAEMSVEAKDNAVALLREKFIDVTELNTMLCDLGENALIAAKGGKVKFYFDCPDNMPQISIYDSGEPFAVQVLAEMGKRKITTHINDGGSGTGLFQTFKILKTYAASFIIDEADCGEEFTKRVIIIPDGKGRHVIRSCREEVKKVCAKRQGFLEFEERPPRLTK